MDLYRGEHPGLTPAGMALLRILREYYPVSDEYHSVAEWNDAGNRQHPEVLEMFGKARASAAESV